MTKNGMPKAKTIPYGLSIKEPSPGDLSNQKARQALV